MSILRSKHSGWTFEGKRTPYIDGGIGEAMLMSAAIGGASSAVTGGDPLKGALLGGLTGGITGGLGGLTGVDSWASQAANTANAGVTGGTSNLISPAVNAIGAGQVATDAATMASMGTNGLESLAKGVNPAANLQGTAQAGTQPFSLQRGMDIVKANPWTYGGIAASNALQGMMTPKKVNAPGDEEYDGPLSKFRYSPDRYTPDVVMPPNPAYKPIYKDYRMAEGGIAELGANPTFPMSQQQSPRYAVPSQMPVGATDVRMASLAPLPMAMGGIATEPATDTYTGQELPLGMNMGGKTKVKDKQNPLADLLKSRDAIDAYGSQYASNPSAVAAKAKEGDYNAMIAMNTARGTPNQNYAHGGISSLGGYSDGGRMLKGPGDGMSDSIPASIGGKQPARLADGEFVVPADVVSHLGNGSTDAGAKKLYAMMDKVRTARTGKKKQARAINPNRFMPA